MPRDAAGSRLDEAITLLGAAFQGTWPRFFAEHTSTDYNSGNAAAQFS
jgi:hypothetical protein